MSHVAPQHDNCPGCVFPYAGAIRGPNSRAFALAQINPGADPNRQPAPDPRRPIGADPG
ncbi:hypothetical protein RA210_U90053 [Rubrivivax sp. A210]|nr:hypothetical protein RA210_U90053 [Rubrivivax sp. A210]